MADFSKARAAFLNLVEELDPDLQCSISDEPSHGNFQIELSRGESGERQFLKVSEEELLALEQDDRETQMKLEERILTTLDLLPDDYEDEEGDEFEDFEDDEIDEYGEEDEDDEDFEDDFGEDDEDEEFEEEAERD